ncbi:hypothetical protein D3C75_1234360 [compost metagenome]
MLGRRVLEQLRDTRFKLQQAGQVGVLADLAFDRTGVQLQLAFAILGEATYAIVLADPEAEVTQADHQGDDQWRQEQMADQAGFHGE